MGGSLSVAAATTTLASGVQGGGPHPPFAYDTPIVALVIVGLTVACGLACAYLIRRRDRNEPVRDQWQAMAVMGELCPDGWDAQLTLYGWGAPIPEDAPASRTPLVELEWRQYAEGSDEAIAVRRAWAPTIELALQKMVDTRRADLALEDIERELSGDRDSWWED